MPRPSPVCANLRPCSDLKSTLSLPSPARGEGFLIPSLDGRGQGDGDKLLNLHNSRSRINTHGARPADANKCGRHKKHLPYEHIVVMFPPQSIKLIGKREAIIRPC
jgi:hypothetical protein